MTERTARIHTPRRRRTNIALWPIVAALTLFPFSPQVAGGRAGLGTATASDSLYSAVHPRLLFDAGDLPGLYAKVRDGGYDDEAYQFIRLMVDVIYPGDDAATILGGDFGLSSVPMLALATFLEDPPDETARAMGRDVTLYLAEHYDVDYNDYDSSLRLRSLALGYDCFFAGAAESERMAVRHEIEAYLDTMTTAFEYRVRLYRPYLGNRSAMVAAAVGLGGIVLDGETDPQRVSDALSFAERLVDRWTEYLVDSEGAYNEGVLYAGWSMRHLVYYFAARKRYDGLARGAGKIRKMERWLAYELLPEGNGKTNNLNDSGYSDDPLPRHHTYFDWAESEWQSGLSAYIYEHVAGPYGWDWGPKADKTATALWNRDLAPVQPDSILSPSMVWEDRGLYYCRTGWPSLADSEDLLLSFYSGIFQGGHTQEDQNQFTLQAFGAKWAVDHGPGDPGKQSESHNIVFIDGNGQHNAGSSIGTDGRIVRFVLGGWADFVQGDATAAYSGHSSLNNYGSPFYFSDWSWGYSGANPVLHARRDIACVRPADGLPPYVFIGDDIDKDGAVHDYQWRLHTASANSVDTSGVETWIDAPSGHMLIHALYPAREAMRAGVAAYNNLSSEPDSRLLTFDVNLVNPHFSFLLMPGGGATIAASVAREQFSWGVLATLDWGSHRDVVVLNFSGSPVTAPAFVDIDTDARVAIVRFAGTSPARYLTAQTQSLVIGGTPFVEISNGPASVVFSGGVIDIDRYDADFTLYGPGVTDIRYRSQKLHFVAEGDYLRPDPSVGIPSVPAAAPAIAASAYPNPFNPSTSITFEIASGARVSVTVYDALGRRVKQLSDRVYAAGSHVLSWDGRDEGGARVASGVYLARIQSASGSATVKLTVVK
jgi:hypothetical protein